MKCSEKWETYKQKNVALNAIPKNLTGELVGLKPASSDVEWPDPTDEDLRSPEFSVIWNVIKTWDINVPEVDGEGVYSGATGNHVKAILDALKNNGPAGDIYAGYIFKTRRYFR